MSDKKLSKSAWETQLKKHDLDDKTLAKALAAYEKCGDKDYAAQVEALEAVEKAATALKKDKKFKEAADYLDDVLDAAAKEGKAAEAKAKEEEEEEETEGEDEEMAEYTKDLPKQLKAALAQVKSRAPGDPVPGAPAPEEGNTKQLRFVAYVAGGSNAVIISKKGGQSVKKLAAKIAKASGGKYYTGECIFEKNAYTFVLDKVPGGLAKRMSKALFEETGLKYKVRVRSTDGATELDDETDVEETEENGNTPEPPVSDGSGEDFKKRLAGLMPQIKEALAAASPESAAIRQKATEAGAAAKQNDFVQGLARLDELEALLKPGSAGATAAPAPDMAAVTTRLKGLMPDLTKAISSGAPGGAEAKTKAAQAGALAKSGRFAEALALLEEVATALQGGQATNEATNTGEQANTGPAENGNEAADGGTAANTDEAGNTGQAAPQEIETDENEEEEKASEGDWEAALAKLEPTYLQVMKTVPEEGARMRGLMQLAQEQAEGGDYKKALASLSQLEKLLGQAGSSEIDGIPSGLVNYRSALVSFAQAKSQAAAQIAALKSAIPNTVPEEQGLADAVADYLNGWNDTLGGFIDAAINAAKNDQAPLNDATRSTLGSYLTDLEKNALIQHADSNSFAPVAIRATIGPALRLIETAMAKL